MSCYCGRHSCETCNPGNTEDKNTFVDLEDQVKDFLASEQVKKDLADGKITVQVVSRSSPSSETLAKSIEGNIIVASTGNHELDEFVREVFETMRSKGHDYRQGNDRDLLHNFRTVAESVGTDMEKVWFTYFYKHYSAMVTFIKEGGQSESEPIEGRIKDQIVYLFLFHQMVQERKRAKVARLGEIYKQAEAADRNFKRLKDLKEKNITAIEKIAREDALHANGKKTLEEMTGQKDEGTGGGDA